MTTVTTRRTDETQIRDLLAGRVEAMRARDADGLVAPYAADAVRFGLAPPLLTAGAAARDADAVRAWLTGFEGPMDAEIRDLRVAICGDVAYCHSLDRLSATPKGSPEGFDLWYRVTTCLRKVDGEWEIAHEHESTPFYMDGSFRAAVDLQP